MHIPGRFSVHRQECEGSRRSIRSHGGRGCEGSENPGLSAQKEVGRGVFSGDNHHGSIDIEEVIVVFEIITGAEFNAFRDQKRADQHNVVFKYLYAALARHFRFSFPQIGRSLHRDHTSAVHYLKRHNVLMNEDEDYASHYKNLTYHAEVLLVK